VSDSFLATGGSSLIIIAIAISLFMFWIAMAADCLKRTFKKPREKILWFLAIIFLQTIGAFIYWLAVQRES
jgi:hypothetical protein